MGLLLRLTQSKHRSDSPNEPQWSNQQVDGISEKRWLISLDGVSDKLKNPADDKQRKRPAPVEEKERQRNDDHRNSDAVCQPVHRMLVFGFVVSQEIL